MNEHVSFESFKCQNLYTLYSSRLPQTTATINMISWIKPEPRQTRTRKTLNPASLIVTAGRTTDASCHVAQLQCTKRPLGVSAWQKDSIKHEWITEKVPEVTALINQKTWRLIRRKPLLRHTTPPNTSHSSLKTLCCRLCQLISSGFFWFLITFHFFSYTLDSFMYFCRGHKVLKTFRQHDRRHRDKKKTRRNSVIIQMLVVIVQIKYFDRDFQISVSDTGRWSWSRWIVGPGSAEQSDTPALFTYCLDASYLTLIFCVTSDARCCAVCIFTFTWQNSNLTENMKHFKTVCCDKKDKKNILKAEH